MPETPDLNLATLELMHRQCQRIAEASVQQALIVSTTMAQAYKAVARTHEIALAEIQKERAAQAQREAGVDDLEVSDSPA